MSLSIVRPGQLWRWAFTVGDGTWFCPIVTDEARWSFVGDVATIVRDDTFIVVSVNDAGPYQMPDYSVILDPESPTPVTVLKQWHVVLFRDQLVWVEDTWFEQCELVCDVG